MQAEHRRRLTHHPQSPVVRTIYALPEHAISVSKQVLATLFVVAYALYALVAVRLVLQADDVSASFFGGTERRATHLRDLVQERIVLAGVELEIQRV